MKDFIPILPGRYLHHPTWSDTLAAREEALRNRHMREAERWRVHTRRLPPPAVSHYVRIQNQTGPYPNKWDKTDIIIEVRQFDQHAVRVDGSGRITLRSRKFLRRYIPVQAPQPQHTIYVDFRYTTQLLVKPAASPILRPTTCQKPLAKAQQAQFPLLLHQPTSAPVPLNQQSTLHLAPSQNTHHHQRPFLRPH